MTLSPGVRKFGLTTHVASSIGWFGSVAGFLALAVTGLTSHDALMMRAAYLAMNVTAWFVILPMAIVALLSGVVQSLGTPWGLFRHYWIIAKLLLTVSATIVLLLKMRLIDEMARAAAATALSSADFIHPRIELAVHSAGGLFVLLVAATLAVYKPRGTVQYGARKRHK